MHPNLDVASLPQASLSIIGVAGGRENQQFVVDSQEMEVTMSTYEVAMLALMAVIPLTGIATTVFMVGSVKRELREDVKSLSERMDRHAAESRAAEREILLALRQTAPIPPRE